MTTHETKRVKKVIVELVRQNGAPIRNKTELFNAFWKSHLHFAAQQTGYLSTWPMIRTASGVAIKDFDYLLSELLADGWLALNEAQVDTVWSIVIALGPSAPASSLPDAAIRAIRDAVQGKVDDGPSSHRESRVWQDAKDGEELDIYLDLMSTEDRDCREASLAMLAEAIGATYSTSRK